MYMSGDVLSSFDNQIRYIDYLLMENKFGAACEAVEPMLKATHRDEWLEAVMYTSKLKRRFFVLFIQAIVKAGTR